jgi:integrase
MAKRSNLEGTKLPDGRWQIRVTVTQLDGSKRRVPLYGSTKAEAQEKAHALIHEDRRSIGNGTTVGELAKVWKQRSWSELAPKTVQCYERSLGHILAQWKDSPVDSLTTPQIVTWLQRLTLGERTVELTRTVFGIMLQFGKLIGANRDNPLAGVRLKRKKRPVQKRITETKFEKVLGFLDEKYHVFFLMLADTGLRPWKEGLPVDRKDIGLSMDQFYVIVTESKTVHGERVVPITDRRVIDYIMDVAEGRLFPFTYEALKTAWRRATDKAGVDADVYSLRRYAISKWCESRPLDEVQRLAGHAQLSLTLQVYNEVQRNRLLHGQGISNGIRVSELVRD